MKPILFNTEMVRAILEGRKTVTRRVVKPQPVYNPNDGFTWKGAAYGTDLPPTEKGATYNFRCAAPCRPGDILYVRETFCRQPSEEYPLALPPEERAQFMEEHHTINGEDKTVIDMTSRELEQAIRERDKARLAAEAAQADAKSAEENRAKMEADMALLKEQCRSSQDAVAAAQKELEELKAKPVDVAVMAVDQEKLDAARAEAVAEMQAKVDKAKAARDKAEENRKAAEAALAEIRTKLEEAGKAERKAAIAGDSDLAVFQLLFEQAQEIANKLHGLLIKAQGREDSSQAAGMQKALSTLAELIRKAAEV